ncbi:MAG: hypothetical protein AB3X44_04760 [Leptothrix sp. (in: b-proteobacteria)]
MAVLILACLIGACVAISEHRKLLRYQLLRRSAKSLISVELRRQTYLDVTGSAEFPQPREKRVMAWRLGGVPFWHQSSSIGLPSELDARINHVAAHEFDDDFESCFRVAGNFEKATFLQPLNAFRY